MGTVPERIRDLKARSLLFLALSGLATGVSWLAYYKALSLAPASRVAPLDKVSLAFTIVLAAVVLGQGDAPTLRTGPERSVPTRR
jgi:transporter family protein